MKTHKIYIAGDWRETDKKLEVIFPYTNEPIGSTYLASDQDMNEAISQAQNSLQDCANLEPYQKAEILKYLSSEVEKQHEEFAELLTLENGKTIKESRLEIDRVIAVLDIASRETLNGNGEFYDLGINPLSPGREAIVKKFPIGVVAGIAPFNFPMNLAMHKIAPAIATGCPIIMKPASSTPLTLLKFAEIIEASTWPKGAFSVIPCNRIIGQQLVEDERISLLSFTGSPVVGWNMKNQAGKKKVVLELGGNAAVIIDKDISDWDYVIDRCVLGSFYQAGQVCISVQKIFIHDDVYGDFRERFIQKVTQMNIGDPRHENTDIGGIIDKKNTDRIKSWVEEAVDQGAECLLGNTAEGTLMKPTILEKTTEDMKVAGEEVFGPVVNLYTYNSINQAIQTINASKFGLQAGIFTDSQENLWKAFNLLEVGGVIHNDVPSFRNDAMPYGGVKDSGFGREGVKYAMADMLEERVLVVKR